MAAGFAPGAGTVTPPVGLTGNGTFGAAGATRGKDDVDVGRGGAAGAAGGADGVGAGGALCAIGGTDAGRGIAGIVPGIAVICRLGRRTAGCCELL